MANLRFSGKLREALRDSPNLAAIFCSDFPLTKWAAQRKAREEKARRFWERTGTAHSAGPDRVFHDEVIHFRRQVKALKEIMPNWLAVDIRQGLGSPVGRVDAQGVFYALPGLLTFVDARTNLLG